MDNFADVTTSMFCAAKIPTEVSMLISLATAHPGP